MARNSDGSWDFYSKSVDTKPKAGVTAADLHQYYTAMIQNGASEQEAFKAANDYADQSAGPAMSEKPGWDQIPGGGSVKDMLKDRVVDEGVSRVSSEVGKKAVEKITGDYAANEAQNQGWNAAADTATEEAAGASASQVIGALAAAKGGYDTAKGWDNGGEGMRSGLTTAGAGIGTMVGGPLGTVLGGAAGNALGYGMQGDGFKNDAMLVALGPVGWTALAAKKLGFGNRQTTRQHQQENTKGLTKVGREDTNWQNYVGAMRGQHNAPPPDPTKPFAGKYASWDEYKKGGLEAGDLTGVYGNLDAFGPKWSGLSFDQQKAQTQKFIDADLYDSKKGEVVFKDKKKAQEMFDKETHDLVGMANPIAQVIRNIAGSPETNEKVTANIVHGLKQDGGGTGGAQKSLLQIIKDMGLSQDQSIQILQQANKAGNMNKDEFNAATYGLGTVFSGSHKPTDPQKYPTNMVKK